MPILKVYDATAETLSNTSGVRVIERYPAFNLVDATDGAARALKRDGLVEDVSDQYQVQAGATSLDTSIPRTTALETVAPPDYDEPARLPEGEHHYIVQFIGPVKRNWLTAAQGRRRNRRTPRWLLRHCATALIGIGATLVLDFWSLFLKFAFRGPSPNFAMVGRWIGHMRSGRLTHASIAEAQPIAGENAIGWIVHYCVGILYAALLVAVCGVEWLRAPTLLPALTIGVATVVAPFLIMQPVMGLGFASSKAPNPAIARLRTLAAHTAFGIGLYLCAVSVAVL